MSVFQAHGIRIEGREEELRNVVTELREKQNEYAFDYSNAVNDLLFAIEAEFGMIEE